MQISSTNIWINVLIYFEIARQSNGGHSKCTFNSESIDNLSIFTLPRLIDHAIDVGIMCLYFFLVFIIQPTHLGIL